MSTRPWTFQRGVLWAMELARAAGGGAAAASTRYPQGAPEGRGAPSPAASATRVPGAAALSGHQRVSAEPPAVQGIASPLPAGTRPPEPPAEAQDRNGPAPAGTLPPPVPAIFEETGKEATAELARAMDMGEPSEVARRFANGRRCFVGRRNGAIVTYAWLSLNREAVGELEREYRLPPGEAYIWDCATLPAQRGGGLYGALLCAVVAVLGAEGQHRAWIGANLENEPSLRAFARAGFQPVVRVAYARLLRLRCMRLSAQPGATSALVQGARAMLTEPYERAWLGVICGVQPRAG